jgi:hypothetical protein
MDQHTRKNGPERGCRQTDGRTFCRDQAFQSTLAASIGDHPSRTDPVDAIACMQCCFISSEGAFGSGSMAPKGWPASMLRSFPHDSLVRSMRSMGGALDRFNQSAPRARMHQVVRDVVGRSPRFSSFMAEAHTSHHTSHTPDVGSMGSMREPSSGCPPATTECFHSCLLRAEEEWPDRPESFVGPHASQFAASQSRVEHVKQVEHGGDIPRLGCHSERKPPLSMNE